MLLTTLLPTVAACTCRGARLGTSPDSSCPWATRGLRAVRTPNRAGCVDMRVDAVESTPNPSAFLLRLEAPLQGLTATGLRGTTFRQGGRSCPPPAIVSALAADGVESIFAAGELITVSKVPTASWESVLPPVIAALGGSSDRLRESGLPSSGGANAPRSSVGGVSIRLQISQGLPIQVEAAGWLAMGPPVRASP